MNESEVIEEYRRKISEEEEKIQQEKRAVCIIEGRRENLRNQIAVIREKFFQKMTLHIRNRICRNGIRNKRNRMIRRKTVKISTVRSAVIMWEIMYSAENAVQK